MYVSGYNLDDIRMASGYQSRSSIFRILENYHIPLNHGPHCGPLFPRLFYPLTKFIGLDGDGFGKITNFAGCYRGQVTRKLTKVTKKSNPQT
jgi:hypothetical protein